MKSNGFSLAMDELKMNEKQIEFVEHVTKKYLQTTKFLLTEIAMQVDGARADVLDKTPITELDRGYMAGLMAARVFILKMVDAIDPELEKCLKTN